MWPDLAMTPLLWGVMAALHTLGGAAYTFPLPHHLRVGVCTAYNPRLVLWPRPRGGPRLPTFVEPYPPPCSVRARRYLVASSASSCSTENASRARSRWPARDGAGSGDLV